MNRSITTLLGSGPDRLQCYYALATRRSSGWAAADN